MEQVTLSSFNLNDQAYHEIKNRIISREFGPGTRLVDSQLAERFGISRTPIRDAMRKLTDEGLLINTSSRGFYVFAPTKKDVSEIFEVSEMVEMAGAAHIIRMLEEEDHSEIEKKVAILAEKATQNRSQPEDEEFKRYLMEIAGNQRLYQIYRNNSFQRVLLANLYFFSSNPADKEARLAISAALHNSIVSGIRAKNLVVTRAAIAEHNHRGFVEALDYIMRTEAKTASK